ncbi:MAG: glutamyl-tRNA reductase [Bacteroidetes bacterium CG_4_10_14_3_um_filter_31_20]|nr:MAG: glutamyl-tRNA reductase [Bacteroidetes bacterium CG_4_10_14_3_um_filter_31_20]
MIILQINKIIMHTLLVGLNYKTTQVDYREKIYFSANQLDIALPLLNSYQYISECVILSTCNRIEIYAASENPEEAYKSIIQFLSDFHKLPSENFINFIYKKRCDDAVKHLFDVASSLNSMILGEYEILGQVKDAYEKAKELNTTKEFFNKLFQMAIVVGKRVRTETGIGKGSISVGSVAVNLIKEIFPSDNKLNVMLVGAGAVSELVAVNLTNKVDCNITVTNRTNNKADEFAKKFNASFVNFESKNQFYNNQDVIVFSTSAQNYIITKEETENLNITNSRKIVLIDLSVPRNIEPEIGNINNVYLKTIDDLEIIIDSSREERLREIIKAEIIIKEVQEKFTEWYNMQSIIPVMRGIKGEFNAIKERLIETYSTQLSSLTDEQKEVIKNIMDSYSDTLIKTIMLNLKEVTDPAHLHHLGDALKRTFKVHLNEHTNNPHANMNNPHEKMTNPHENMTNPHLHHHHAF